MRQTVFILAVLSAVFTTLHASAENLRIASPGYQVPGYRGILRAAEMSKAGSTLLRTFAEFRSHRGRQDAEKFQPRSSLVQYANGRVVIDARATEQWRFFTG